MGKSDTSATKRRDSDFDVEAHERDMEARRSEQRRREIITAANLPKRHAEFNGDLSPECFRKFEQLDARLGTGMLVAIVGGRGTGKTQVACRLADAAARMLMSVRYIHIVELFMKFREAYRKDGPSELQVVQGMSKTGLLIIDDIHDRRENEWEDQMLSYMIDARYAAMRDTLIISNQTPDVFRRAIGESIYSRLVEAGGVMEFNWSSMRKAKT